MDKEKELELVKKYPNLYKEYGGDMRETCMHWGMTCGNGWYNLINELSEKLEKLGVVAAQVKEKFGGLRFYLNPCNEDVWEEAHNLVREAEIKSFETCEICGTTENVETKGPGWIRTLCNECRNKD